MVFSLAVSQPTTIQDIQVFKTNQGARIFQLPLEAFPGFWAYAYLVLVDGYQVLIDTGSGFGICNEHLESGLREVNFQADVQAGLPYLTHVLITHGHIDHFGGLSYVRANSQALVGVHELDMRNLTNTEERLAIVSRRLSEFLTEAGIPWEQRNKLIQLYQMTKLDYVPVKVDFTYEKVGMEVGPFKLLHVPGHCAGHVVLRLHDVLFSGDHILSDISPHQAPERLVLHTGLNHYLQSLEAIRNWGDGINLVLGGHNAPVIDLMARVDEIIEVHNQRLARVLEILKDPQTVLEVSRVLFKDVNGYNALLALEEAGAHVEYLSQRGLLGISNLDEVKTGDSPVAIYYQAGDRF